MITAIRPLLRTLASIGLAGLVACAVVGPAAAAEPANGYTVTAYGSVGCDAASSSISVSAFAMTWQGEGALLGWQPTEYDAGQWMRYDVLVREVGQADWTTIYTWSDWAFVRTMTVTGDMAINTPAELGTSVVQALPGHAYEVLVQVDFWTGVDNVYDTETTYLQALSTGPASTYYLNPSACWF